MYVKCELPKYEEALAVLPEPIWEGHESTIKCYYKTWEIAFGNLRGPREGYG